MIGSIQMEKPAQNSSDYYLSFYNMYNLLQINDAVIFSVFDEAVEAYHLTTQHLLNMTNSDNYALELRHAILSLGVCPPDNIVEMCKENRGIDASFANELQKNNIDPFEWFRNINEFVQLYAIFEQAIKEFLGNARIGEKDIIDKLITHLENDALTNDFLDRFGFKTFEIIKNVEEIKAVWAFYTKVRNCILYSGGRLTQKVIDGFNEIKSQYRATLGLIEKRDWICNFFLINEDDEYTLFNCNYSVGDMLYLDKTSLNFFRMFCVFFVETLNKLH